MERYSNRVKWSCCLFAFSDLSSTKRRPALILRSLATYGDIVALAVTSRSGHPAGVPLESVDFELGSLPKLHTIDQSLILDRIGKLTPEAYERVLKAVCSGLGCVGGS
jgi:mRNA-degrading endonuclease toxin of MazEF toxin-antitoxin module